MDCRRGSLFGLAPLLAFSPVVPRICSQNVTLPQHTSHCQAVRSSIKNTILLHNASASGNGSSLCVCWTSSYGLKPCVLPDSTAPRSVPILRFKNTRIFKPLKENHNLQKSSSSLSQETMHSIAPHATPQGELTPFNH
jgi:hypothetical protein